MLVILQFRYWGSLLANVSFIRVLVEKRFHLSLGLVVSGTAASRTTSEGLVHNFVNILKGLFFIVI